MRPCRCRAHGRTGPDFRTSSGLLQGHWRKKKEPKAADKKHPLAGKKVVVTAGPCREAIDPVRFISNRSSGKMGYALARAAVEIGAEVVLISGPTNLTAPPGATSVSVETTQEMFDAVAAAFDSCDCLIMAAAPADYRPVVAARSKLKKKNDDMSLSLTPTVDILKEMGKRKRKGQLLIGFALETDNGLANARTKLKAKNLDMVVLNSPSDPDSAFDHDTNKVTLIVPDKKPEELPLLRKEEVAVLLLARVGSMC